MIVVDLNVLIYAVNASSTQHATVLRWWHEAVNGEEPVGLPWIVLSGFLRLTTRAGILPNPLSPNHALVIVTTWLEQDNIVVPRESDSHWPIFRRLIAEAGTAGNLVSDAHLAALAIGHGARLATCDRDFARFQGLRCISPVGTG